MSFVGVNLTVDDVKLVLSDYTENKNSASYNGHLMLSTLSNMFANAMSGKSVKTAEKLWEDNNNNYKYFARTLSAVYEEFTEDSMNVNAKTFYSHTYPSFLSKFIKKMKNTSGIAANFEKFVQESFRQYVGTIYNENTGEYNIP
jgi:ABC-type Zn2+ transport system substrate-binding protein/surface adhesin